MKRIARRLVLFLVLGAIINIAVSWGFALWSNPYLRPATQYGFSRPSGIAWYYETFPQFGVTLVRRTPVDMSNEMLLDYQRWLMQATHTSECAAPPWSAAHQTQPDYLLGDHESFKELATGCPLRTLVCDFLEEMPQHHNLRQGFAISGMGSHVLPLRPIWPGFAINTIFYAAILWLLFAFPFALRRRMRARRGRCVACGYDLRGGHLNLCPECGMAA